jgi:hypothetical protein
MLSKMINVTRARGLQRLAQVRPFGTEVSENLVARKEKHPYR